MRAEYRGGSAPIQLSGSDFRLRATRGIVSADVCKHTLKLIEGVVTDHQLTLSFLPVADLHRRPWALGQTLLEAGNIRVRFGRFDRLGFATQPLANQCLGLAHGKTA